MSILYYYLHVPRVFLNIPVSSFPGSPSLPEVQGLRRAQKAIERYQQEGEALLERMGVQVQAAATILIHDPTQLIVSLCIPASTTS